MAIKHVSDFPFPSTKPRTGPVGMRSRRKESILDWPTISHLATPVPTRRNLLLVVSLSPLLSPIRAWRTRSSRAY
ncbi:hypothetical protein V2G26_009060 [Clonostachys chloroleuca]